MQGSERLVCKHIRQECRKTLLLDVDATWA